MVRDIPETGKRALYVGSHTGAIEGVPDDVASTLIDELLDFATAPDKVYTHKWREGDAILRTTVPSSTAAVLRATSTPAL